MQVSPPGQIPRKDREWFHSDSSWALKGGRKHTPREEVKEEVGVREAGAWVLATQATFHEHRAHSSLPPSSHCLLSLKPYNFFLTPMAPESLFPWCLWALNLEAEARLCCHLLLVFCPPTL